MCVYVYIHVSVHVCMVHHCVFIVHLGMSEGVSRYIQVRRHTQIVPCFSFIYLQLFTTKVNQFVHIYLFQSELNVCELCPYWGASLGVSPTNLTKGHSGRMHTQH